MAMGIREKTSPSQMIKPPDGIPQVLRSSMVLSSYQSSIPPPGMRERRKPMEVPGLRNIFYCPWTLEIADFLTGEKAHAIIREQN